ncbi:MAG: DUF4418 family protein [Thermincola sp.]|jgi:hypothetical protein|nr:DUF4418 family protein [Thermincola sp.]MDT3702267.1 DUF4418 family protein [Thermincola sp.]
MGQKIWNGFAVASLVLGGLISLTPLKLAPVCKHLLTLANGSKIHMTCYWTGQAEVIMGLLVMAGSLLMLLLNREGGKRALGVMLGILGVAIIIIPSKLGIGICGNSHMACHTTAKFLYIWAAGLIILGIVALFKSEENKRPGTIKS